MENDQIKSQIENAKRAFVASKERDREVSSAELDIDEAQLQENILAKINNGIMVHIFLPLTGHTQMLIY